MKNCPTCSKVVEGHPNKKFCNLQCKDAFHNAKQSASRRTVFSCSPVKSGKKKNCKYCSRGFTGHPNKKFCNTRCKDNYHNLVNPRGYGAEREEIDYEGYGWDAHKEY